MQELANLTWAFATAGHLDAELFTVLARVAEQCIGDSGSQNIANTAWAFSKTGQSDCKLFMAFRKAL